MSLRLMIPNNLLSVLSEWYPTMQVIEINGSGSASVSSHSSHFEFGNVISQVNNKVIINWRARGISYARDLKSIYAKINELGVLNATISKLVYTVKLKGFNSDYGNNTFIGYTPHKSLDKKRISDGGRIPEDQLYKLVQGMALTIDAEYKKNYRSSVLVLTTTNPANLLEDENYIRTIREQGMFIFQFNKQEWILKNVDFKKTGKLKLKGGA